MKRVHLLRFLFLFLLSAAVALYITLLKQATSFTILDHTYILPVLPFSIILVVSFFVLWGVWRLSLFSYWKFSYHQDRIKPLKGLLTLAPVGLLFLSPVPLLHYLDKNDLLLRMKTLGIIVVVSVVVLEVGLWVPLFRKKRILEEWIDRFSKLSGRKKLVVLFVISFIIYNVCGLILVSKNVTFSGDEPYYLLTTHSLIQDKDINVANNYAEKDYFHFYSEEENPGFKLPMYARAGRKGRAFIYPINLSGISFLMLPFYWLSQFFKGNFLIFILKTSLSVWAILLGLQLYLFVKERWNKEGTALLLWVLYSFTSPILFYAVHLYPEIPIALFSIYVYRKVSLKKDLSSFQIFFLGFILSLFIWFGLKYNMIFFPLLAVSIFYLLKVHKVRQKILLFLLSPVLSVGFFYLYLYQLYGSFSPFSIYEGVMTPEKVQAFKEMMVQIPVLLRIDTFIDYFLDQRDGLLLYSPFYVFAFLGMVECFRKAKRELIILLCLFLPFVVNYAFFSHRQGYSPQGRILAPLTWIGAIFIGYFLIHNKKRFYSGVFVIFSALSLLIPLTLLTHPSFLYQPTTHEVSYRAGDMFVFLGNMHLFLPHLLPSFIKVNNLGYAPNYIWILALAAFILVYIFYRGESKFRAGIRLTGAVILLAAIILLWVAFPRPALYPTQTFQYSEQKAMGFYLSPMGEGVVAKKMAELHLHQEKEYRILFSSRTELDKIRITFGSEKGEYSVRFSMFDLPLFDGKTSFERKTLEIFPKAHYPYKNLFLYEINLELKKLSSESMLVDPYFFQIVPLK
jgi:hypothetical protein